AYSNFFFQAEDGIRDRNVTGVQTCALPILDLFKVVIQRTLMTSSQFVDDIVVKKFAVSHKNGIVKNEFNVRYQVCSYDHQRVWPHSCDDRIQSGVTSGRVDPADWLI